jgi:histidinol dehydrogenase
VDRIFKIGGAQGVAALACGAAPVPRVDKIVGPGSVWVTAAKAIAVSRGLCGIDSLAGPSEVVVVADGSADPGCVAADLLSQAEHGGDSVAILVTTSRSLAKKAGAELDALVKRGPWPRDVTARVRAIVVKGLAQAAEAVNDIAPEHLEIIVKNPRAFLKKVRNAASIFIGPYSPVPAGDYMAGGNHVLPTGGTARWSSPLSVHDFVKRQSITELSKAALASIKEPAARFAEIEGLPAHALAVRKRFSR